MKWFAKNPFITYREKEGERDQDKSTHLDRVQTGWKDFTV